MNGITLELKNDLDELDVLKGEVRGFCGGLGLDRKVIFQLLLAVEEIFVNIVSYAFPEDDRHRIRFAAERTGDVLTLRFEDDGVYFNPLTVEAPDVCAPVEERDVGGLGLHLTRSVMDEIAYDRICESNRLTLRKRLKTGVGDDRRAPDQGNARTEKKDAQKG